MADQFAAWRHAIETGTRIETERGNPRSGFYRQTTGKPEPQHIEAIAIYRDSDGKLQCLRNVFGDGAGMSESEIDDLFGKVCVYPIPEELFRGITERGEQWPPEFATRLTMKDQTAGVAWTPAYGRKRLGLDAKPAEMALISATSNEGEKINTPAENPRAVIGDNRPPEETPPAGHTIDGEQTPHKVMFAEVSALAAGVKQFLDGIGGKPRDKAEADTLGDYAVKFKDLSNKAEDARKTEKQPHLDAGREVDERWKSPKNLADGSRRRCLEIAQAFMDAENARRTEVAEQTGTEAKPVTSVGNVRAVSTRTNTLWVVTDAKAYVAHLLTLGELPPEIVEAAGKVAQRRGEQAPGVEKRTERRAA